MFVKFVSMNEEIVAHPVQQFILPVILAHCTLVLLLGLYFHSKGFLVG